MDEEQSLPLKKQKDSGRELQSETPSTLINNLLFTKIVKCPVSKKKTMQSLLCNKMVRNLSGISQQDQKYFQHF